MEKLIKRQDAIDVVAKAYRYESDRLTALQELPTVDVTEKLDKLEEYEGLEEQGKLLKLPCVVGDTVYRINKGAKEPIISMAVVEVGTLSLKAGGLIIQISCRDNADGGETSYLNTDFGNIIFRTREQAEAALKHSDKLNC